VAEGCAICGLVVQNCEKGEVGGGLGGLCRRLVVNLFRRVGTLKRAGYASRLVLVNHVILRPSISVRPAPNCFNLKWQDSQCLFCRQCEDRF